MAPHTGPAISAPRPSVALSQGLYTGLRPELPQDRQSSSGSEVSFSNSVGWNRQRGWLKTQIPRLQPDQVDLRVRAFQMPGRKACVQEKGVWGQRRGDLLQGMSPQPAQSADAGLSSWEGGRQETEADSPVWYGDLSLWCWRRLLRVPWMARRSNRSILKEMNPEYSLEGLMLKLKLQYFGHLMQRIDSLEKTLMLGKIEGRRRRG